jgi:hypothetical protein
MDQGADKMTVTHPVQFGQSTIHPSEVARVPELVALRAYEVYCHICGEQPAMVDVEKGCRGGFSVGEIVAFLYARAFPKEQWRQRFGEAQTGMTLR